MSTLNNRYTANSSADIEKMTDLMYKLLNVVWGNGWGVFSDESPTGNDPGECVLPHITYNLESREHVENRTIKQTEFDSFPDPDNPGYNIKLMKKWFDCTMEFCIYAATRKEATRWAQRFEEFMETYVGYFKQEGIQEIIFIDELAPQVAESRQDIPHRTVRYLVRIERTTPVRTAHLKEVEAIINVEHPELPLPLPQKESHVSATQGAEQDFMKLYEQHFPK